jgi:hypothetical protein
VGTIRLVLADESHSAGDEVESLRLAQLYVWAREKVLLVPNWKYCKDMGGAKALFQYNTALVR